MSAVLEPIQAKREALDKLTKTVGQKEDQLLNLARSKKLLKDWQARSLPPDLTKDLISEKRDRHLVTHSSGIDDEPTRPAFFEGSL